MAAFRAGFLHHDLSWGAGLDEWSAERPYLNHRGSGISVPRAGRKAAAGLGPDSQGEPGFSPIRGRGRELTLSDPGTPIPPAGPRMVGILKNGYANADGEGVLGAAPGRPGRHGRGPEGYVF